MARRIRDEELPFSLDSFLDIVANLVGILIRLIVMVGLTVRSMPARPAAPTDSSLRVERERENARRQSAREAQSAERERELERRAATLANRRVEQTALDAAADRHARELAARRAALARFAAEAAALADEARALDQQSENARAALQAGMAAGAEQAAALDRERLSLATLQGQVTEAQAELDRERAAGATLDAQFQALAEALRKLRAAPKPVLTWTHFGAHVAQALDLEERHFRCQRGRVADTGLHTMLEQVRARARSGADRTIALEGRAGPLRGFALSYALERRTTTPIERASGHPAELLDIRQFELEEDGAVPDESAGEALAAGSRFWTALADGDPARQAVTLWVHPDSFALAKELEMALQRRGFTVAARPLPFGANIRGSPSGHHSQGR